MVSIPSEFTRYRVDFMRGFVAPRMIYCLVVSSIPDKGIKSICTYSLFNEK